MIALLGYKGSIGARYAAILKHLDIPFIGIEKDDPIPTTGITKAIIATPTPTHFEVAEGCEKRGIPYLLEKPATKDFEQAKEMSTWKHGFIVNNYAFSLPEFVESMDWDFYNSGRDGLHWDCAQIIYLGKKRGARVSIKNASPVWTFLVNGIQMPYSRIERSYIHMIRGFVADYTGLMPMTEALAMHQAVTEFR